MPDRDRDKLERPTSTHPFGCLDPGPDQSVQPPSNRGRERIIEALADSREGNHATEKITSDGSRPDPPFGCINLHPKMAEIPKLDLNQKPINTRISSERNPVI